MASGGHSRSGPPPVEGSRDSDRKGFSLTALPFAGYAGEAPELVEFMPSATARHQTIWAQLWTTPQACAWSLEAWRWPIAADLVKWMVRSDDSDAPAAMATTVRQLRDDLGLSSAGLRQNGWKVAEAPAPEGPSGPVATVTDIKSRLTGGA